jgi:hypothetical protein
MTGLQPKTRRFGYASVRTYGQTFDIHLGQLRCDGGVRFFRGKASGGRAADGPRLRRQDDEDQPATLKPWP